MYGLVSRALHVRQLLLHFLTGEITFLDLCLYKGERFAKEGILDIKTHIKPTNTQQYVHASSAQPPGTGQGITSACLSCMTDTQCPL